MNQNKGDLEVIPILEFQNNFDFYINKIENEKKSIIIEDLNGNRAVMVPADDEILKIHTEHNDAC